MKVPKSHLLSFFLIGIIALFFRFYNLTAESLWADEATSITVSWGSLDDLIRFSLEVDKVPPGYNLLLHFWMKIFGVSELAIRSLSVITGVMGVLAIVAFTRRFFGMEAAFFTGILTSISEFYIYYAQEVRTYSIFLFLAVLSFYYFARLLEEERVCRKDATIYIIVTALMFYFHYYGLFLLFSQAIILLSQTKLVRWKKNLDLLGLQVGAFSLFVPWLYIFVRQVLDVVERHAISERIGERTAWSILNTYAMGSSKVTLVVIILLLIGLMSLWKEGKGRKAIFLGTWGILPPLIAYYISEWITPIFRQRYLIGASPPFYILVGLGISCVVRYSERVLSSSKRIIWLSGGISILIVILGWEYLIGHYYKPVIKDRWHDLIQHIETQTSGEEEEPTIIANPGWGIRPLSYYIVSRNLGWKFMGVDLFLNSSEARLLTGPTPWDSTRVEMHNMESPSWKGLFSHKDIWVVIINPISFRKKREYALPWIEKAGGYKEKECRYFSGEVHRPIYQESYSGVLLCHLERNTQ